MSIVFNAENPVSKTDLAILVFTSFLALRSPTTMSAFSLTSFVLALCKWSLRQFAILACNAHVHAFYSWVKLVLTQQLIIPEFELSTYIYIISAAFAVGLGYAAWNIGIVHGNITLLVAGSYFTPIISSLIAIFILQTELSISFWQGTAMVTLGSFICWLLTNFNKV